MSKAELEIEVRGVKVPVIVSTRNYGGGAPSANFTAVLDPEASGSRGQESSPTLEGLYQSLLKRFKTELLELGIPVVVALREGAKRGKIVGVHGRSGDLIVAWDKGGKSEVHSYSHWLSPLMHDDEIAEYNEHIAMIKMEQGAMDAIAAKYEVDFRREIEAALIKPALDAALAEEE